MAAAAPARAPRSEGGPELADAMLSVSGLVAGYGRLPVLHDISFSVAPGSLTTIIGPNGAGKTTLTKAIVHVVDIMGGAIVFEGRTISAMPAHQIIPLGIGYVPQSGNVFPTLTVDENLEISSNLVPRARRAEEIEKVYERFPRLRERRRQRGQSLSGGERQMLAIGSALLAAPKLLILDEPVTGLSPQLTDEVTESIVAINRAGTTVLWVVEENPQQVIEHADWVCVMDGGAIRISKPAAEILATENLRELFLGI